jgi:hypothetical protein
MKAIILFCLILSSCAHMKKESETEDLVSLNTALDQAQASYLKGCVDALHDIKVPMAFEGCRDKSLIHRRELDQIMEQDL